MGLERIKMFEEAGIISQCLPLVPIIVPKKAQPEEQPQKHSCVDYCARNSFLPQVVKAILKLKVFFPSYLYQ